MGLGLLACFLVKGVALGLSGESKAARAGDESAGAQTDLRFQGLNQMAQLCWLESPLFLLICWLFRSIPRPPLHLRLLGNINWWCERKGLEELTATTP